MKIATRLIILLLFMSALKLFAQEETIKFAETWKFIQGDNLEYAKPDFNDSQWKSLRVDRVWESQGYDPYDGYAWYRVKIFIPSSLKDKAYLKDSLKIFLGKINNFDQTFLNGKIIGINGKNVPSNAIITNEFTNAPQILLITNTEPIFQAPANFLLRSLHSLQPWQEPLS